MALGLGLLVGLVATEGFLQLTQTRPPSFKRMVYEPVHPFQPVRFPPFWVFKPNYDGFQVYYTCTKGECTEDSRIRFQTNSRRMRDVEHSLEKPEGTWRLLVLGDSFSVADGVPREAAYHQRLLEVLQEQWPSRKVEVINTSVQAYSTLDQWQILQRGIGYEPDMVLVGLYLNDTQSSMANWVNRGQVGPDQGIRWDHFQTQQGRLGPWLPPVSAIDRLDLGSVSIDADHFTGNVRRDEHYNQPFLLLQWAASFLWGQDDRAGTIATLKRFWSNDNGLGLLELEWSLEQMARIHRGHELPMLVAIFPWMDGLDGEYALQEEHDRLHQILDANGLPWVDLLEPFQAAAAQGQPLWAHQTDHHPSREMHGRAAEVLLPLVKKGAKSRPGSRSPHD